MVEPTGVPKEAIREKLATISGVANRQTSATEAWALAFALDGGGTADLRRHIFRAAVDNHWPLLELVRESVSLEEVFRNLTTRDDDRPEEARP